ncbi:acyl-CoA:lysophosphatidylglycerol acyltransferase 1-like isoform X2 [Coccinella septempunctata]|uniref:acyl-CoA:lysophosphatidylglycerol acyltransferase 1-like isoform X2 n=1 Tax=Coccinella septempunctata TaxID=41139 RepID=UPI001D060DC0|nr:acyl-CoA:lysophosphatidylglycerol acyltransferase 1-like isoform X2 [Coccinella septempunctata]
MVLEAGDDITPCLEERSLVLVNHQSPGDVIILFSAFIGWHQILPNVMWIMDHFIKYSTVGIVSSIRKDFFIFQGRAMRNESLKALAEHIRNFYLPLKRKWLILFPEGGLLCKRKKNSQKYGKLNNLPHLELVTIPRVGALKVIMNELKGEVPDSSLIGNHEVTHELKYILDVTIGYPKGKPLSLLSIIFGDAPPCKIVIYYRLFPIDEIPLDDEVMKEWLLSKWVEKEKLLAEFYDTGEFPLKPNSVAPRPIIPGYTAINCSNSAKKSFLIKHFPKDHLRRKQWMINMNRHNWRPTDYSCFWEKHGKKRVDRKRASKPTAIPTIFAHKERNRFL